MFKLNKDNRTLLLYWSLPLVLFALQLVYTTNSTNQIRYEELAESVRNVWWLQNGTIYDGVSSNVGWYGTLLLVYKFFGFSIFTAKYFRLVLSLISLICLAAVLKKYLGEKKAIIPLLAIGISPTLLFFNTLQSSFGTDLQYIPICIFLILQNFQKNFSSLLRQALLGATIMVAWMSYPTFVFYIPVLGILYLRQIKSLSMHRKTKNIVITTISFVTPFVLVLLALKDRQLLFFDEKTKSGIFRGAGNFTFNINTFIENFGHTIADVTSKPNSYYYEVVQGDFSLIIPLLSLISILTLSIYLIAKSKNFRFVLALSWTVLLLNLMVANFTSDPSGQFGIRRETASLAAIYSIFVIVWLWVLKHSFKNSQIKNLLIGILLLVPLHHVIVYPINLGSLGNPSPYKYSHIFSQFGTPDKSLNPLVNIAKTQDLKLSCTDSSGKSAYCRYVEAYAAVAGYCSWNNIDCHQILGYDNKTEKFIPLTTKLWEDYYWEH